MRHLQVILTGLIFFGARSCTSYETDKAAETKAADSLRARQEFTRSIQVYGDPNSAYRNEDSLIALLGSQLKSPWYSAPEKQAIQIRLTLCLQNRPGHTANDFSYITPGGEKKTLYGLSAKKLLLFFYNPECEACKQTKAAMIASPVITRLIESGKLRLLAIYTDRDQSIWRKHLPSMPRQWLQGRDEEEYLYKNGVYDLKAIPTLYLLDSDKKVLLKDATVEEIISYF